MVESQIKLSERALINNPNIKTKSELELKADLITEGKIPRSLLR